MMKKLLVLLLFGALALNVQADIISVNFAEREDQQILPEETAGMGEYAAAHFNNFIGANGDGSLVDQFGRGTGATLTYNSSNMWGDGTAGLTTADDRLSRGYLDDGQTTEPYGVVIQVSNVPYSHYRVIVYHATDNATGYTDVNVNGQTQNIPTTYRWGTVRRWTEGVNCLVFKGLTGETLDIKVLSRYADGNGNFRGSVAGFQIVSETTAADPIPANEAKNVPVQTTLEWAAPSAYEAMYYHVYMDPNAALVEEGRPAVLLTTVETPSTDVSLLYDQTYFWRVDAVDPNEGGNPIVHPGRVWTFTTAAHPSTQDPHLYTPEIVVLNPSFEKATTWQVPTPDWFDYGAAYQEGPFPTPFGLIWGVTEDGIHWQPIGTWTPNVDYAISVAVGKRSGFYDGRTKVSLWAGGTVPPDQETGDATTPSGVGATLIAEYAYPRVIEENGHEHHTAILNTGTAHNVGDPLFIAFTRAEGSITTDRAHFDNVRVQRRRDPRSAWGPNPAHGQTGVSISAPPTLTWQQGVNPETNYQPEPSVTGYHIYFGSDRDAVGRGDASTYKGYRPVGQESITITDTLIEFSPHYWRVDEELDNGEILTGGLWTFTTDLSNRLIAHWKFDGNLNDQVAVLTGSPEGDWPGQWYVGDPNNPVTEPVFEEGLDGQAIRFTRGDGSYLVIPGTEEFFNFYTEGFTVSLWYKPTDYALTDGFMGLIAKRSGNFGWHMYDIARFYGTGIEGRIDGTTITPGGRLDDGNWHLVVLTYDNQTKTMAVYRDGKPAGTAELTVTAGVDAAVTLGVSNIAGEWEYDGLIDDVRIFSYPLEPLDVARLYVELEKDKTVCLNHDDPALRFDFNGDCVVNLADFAELALGWAQCNVYPDCY
jgi:hypothetical protein